MSESIVKKLLLLIGLVAFLSVGYMWFVDDINKGLLDFTVNPVAQIEYLETKYLYLLLMVFSFVPVFFLSFDKWVAYYKEWRYLVPAILIMAIPFIVWDILFTEWQVWGFNEAYYSGIVIGGLPIEEWLFFLIIPFACGFIYQNIKVKAKRDWYIQIEPVLSYVLLGFFLFSGFLAWGRIYSMSAFLLMGSLWAVHIAVGNKLIRARFLLSYAWCLIPFTIIDGLLTGIGTKEPIVVYNPEEFLGWRMWTIPVDDMVYGMLLVFGVVLIFEYFRGSTKKA